MTSASSASSASKLPKAAPFHPASERDEWWRSGVIYQVYPRSFADANGDGIGDMKGIASRLEHLRDLGVDAVWISPFYPSPQKDAGYDVSDYCDVEPMFGNLRDADDLIERAHELGLKVIFDLVPNHTSDQHPWFQRALAAEPGSYERDWYIFRDIDPENPDTPPNNWESVFGNSAWSKTPNEDQWYLHLFDSSQPDLNWNKPAVRESFLDILEFWLDRGVDGFRVDVAHGLVKADGLPDTEMTTREMAGDGMATQTSPYWDQDGVHEIYPEWRKLLDSYPGDRAMVAEAWVEPYSRIARYVRPDEFHQAFNFSFLDAPWDAAFLAKCIRETYEANDVVGAPATWVLSNHDVIRPATRLALDPKHLVSQLAEAVPEPDPVVGAHRARAASTLMLGLPGSGYLYQGEELGLPEVLDLDDDSREDPIFIRTAGERLGRDGCRVPIPWTKDAPSFGFGDNNNSWLPQPELFGDLAVDQQAGDPDSALELYRTLLRIRRERGLGSGSLDFVEPAEPTIGTDDSPADESGLLIFDVGSETGTTRVVLNTGTTPWRIPDNARVLVSSWPGVTDSVLTDCAVWLALD